ncbi:hypothetical protein QBZ16_001741 [Prototheca wickerhamii]|uniref:Uncharacterized protein n=1 Tax=Prototheca wickerhamii TaxID=3111 RepID=A0AAD9MK32_PROWI|nr:hypothetical protein QBZ16_001741 [Prototheca wickerhamii]
MRLLVCVLALAVAASAFHERFDGGWESRWVHSEDAKYAGNRLSVTKAPNADVQALKTTDKARHYGISAALPEPVDPSKDLVLQYELQLPEGGISCGGAYLKFLTATGDFTPAGLTDATPYTVMFGPDRCGLTNKVHLILRHKSPKTGEVEEKHLLTPPSMLNDALTHVYTAELYASNNSYRVLVDGEEKKAGSLFEDFSPAINPPAEISDPEDVKPADWVDEAKIPDATATKPEDWDEDAPAQIPDASAVKPADWLDDEPAEIEDPAATVPEDWDEEEDGEWEAPLIPNPKCAAAGCGPWTAPLVPNPAYRGKWSAPLVDNPAYQGPWAPRQIPNPAYHVDDAPLAHVGAVGGVAIEIWTMDAGYLFSNVIVSNDPAEAAAAREALWRGRHAADVAAEAEALAAKEAAAKQAGADSDDEESDDEEDTSALAPITLQARRVISAVFALPVLRPYAKALRPARKLAEAYPGPVVGAVAGVLVLAALSLLQAVGRAVGAQPAKPRKLAVAAQKQAAAAKKKTDEPTKDDARAEDEESSSEEIEEEDKPAAASAARRRTRRD